MTRRDARRDAKKKEPTRIELGEGATSVVADLASPDDAMVSLQVAAMQRALQALVRRLHLRRVHVKGLADATRQVRSTRSWFRRLGSLISILGFCDG